MTESQHNAIEYTIGSLSREVRYREKCGELDVAREIDEHLAELQDMLDTAEIIEATA